MAPLNEDEGGVRKSRSLSPAKKRSQSPGGDDGKDRHPNPTPWHASLLLCIARRSKVGGRALRATCAAMACNRSSRSRGDFHEHRKVSDLCEFCAFSGGREG
jgi:hypothetical protein